MTSVVRNGLTRHSPTQPAKIIWKPFDLQNQISLKFVIYLLKKETSKFVFIFSIFYISWSDLAQQNETIQKKFHCLQKTKLRFFIFYLKTEISKKTIFHNYRKKTVFLAKYNKKMSKKLITKNFFRTCAKTQNFKNILIFT